jgi:hypothetical protein
MKHKIALVICLALIAGTGLYAKQIHDQYQATQARAAAIAQSVKLKAEAVANQREAQFLANVAQNETWCAHDKIGYNVLTPAQKLHAIEPICYTNLVN